MLSYYTRTPTRLGEHRGRTRRDGTPFVTREQRFRQQERTTEPLDPARVSVWKQAMSAEERERFRLIAGDLLRDMGYEL